MQRSPARVTLVDLVNLRTGVTSGQYPVQGVVMKLMFSADGQRLFAVTNSGHFVALDLARRAAVDKEGTLLCEPPA